MEMHLGHGRAETIRHIEPDHGWPQASFTMTTPACSSFFSTAAAMLSCHPHLWQCCLSRKALMTASDFPLGTQVSHYTPQPVPTLLSTQPSQMRGWLLIFLFPACPSPASPALLTPAMSPASQASMWKNHCEGKSCFYLFSLHQNNQAAAPEDMSSAQ